MKKKLNCVLLIDDNDSDNFLHKKVIEKADITNHIEIALNGKEALDLLAIKGKCGQPEGLFCQPELIFLDINMPIMDGWEFLAEYQKLESFQKGKLVAIMLTTSLNPSDRIKAEEMLAMGCFQYKPLTLQMLKDILQKHFPEYL